MMIKFLKPWRRFKKDNTYDIPGGVAKNLCRGRNPYAEAVGEVPEVEIETASVEPECIVHDAPVAPKKRRGRPRKKVLVEE